MTPTSRTPHPPSPNTPNPIHSPIHHPHPIPGATVLRVPLSLCLSDPAPPGARTGLEGLSPAGLAAWRALPWQVSDIKIELNENLFDNEVHQTEFLYW